MFTVTLNSNENISQWEIYKNTVAQNIFAIFWLHSLFWHFHTIGH